MSVVAILLTAALAVSPLAYANCKHCKCNKKHTRHHKSTTTSTTTMQKSEATQNAQNPASVGTEQPAQAAQ